MPFVGVRCTNQHETRIINFTFNDGSTIQVTPFHRFVTQIQPLHKYQLSKGVEIHACLLQVGDVVEGMMGNCLTIEKIEAGQPQPTFDLVEVLDNKYKTNNVISHNCEFLSSDPLLIDSMVLANLEKSIKQPLYEDLGYKFWQKLTSRKTYLIGVDPATGTNQDFTTIQCRDYQDMSLVCEFRSNTLSSPNAYATLKMLLKKINDIGSTCYFSVENNGVGEGIIALYESDETIPESAEFISEEGANRLGMRTENKVKLRTCLVLKQMIENGTFPIVSETMLKELRSFIAQKGNYSAQTGATDDLITGSLVIIRLLGEMATYDQKAFDMVNNYETVHEFTVNPTVEQEPEYDDNYEPDGFII